MIWLFPLYLLGAAAVLGPILMHLRRRPPQDRVEFSSLMFLDAQTPMPVSKRRLEHWLLLLLRCLVLLLLAFMFARPLWRGEAATALGQNQATILLLDRSASMRRGDLWAQAVAQTLKALPTAPADRVAVAVWDDELTPLWTLAEDAQSAGSRAALIRQRLQATQPGWAGTDLGLALTQAASWFSRETGLTGLTKSIVLITDFQEGSQLEALRSRVWPENIRVKIQQVSLPRAADNFSLTLAAINEAAAARAEAEAPSSTAPSTSPLATTATQRVRLGSARDSQVADYTLAWETGGGVPLSGYLPAGASRVLPVPPAGEGARVLRLSGDAWDFDNRVFIAPPQPRPVQLVFIGEETTRDQAASPLFYLSRALQKTATLLPELSVRPAAATSLPEGTDIVFIASPTLAPPLLAALRSFLQAGGLVVQVVEEATPAATLTTLAGLPAGSVQVAPGRPTADYLMLAEVDATQPLLGPFADDRLRDFTKLRFWKHRLLTLTGPALVQVPVIARFDNGAPALLTTAVGQGRLLWLTSGWHPADSQLALSTKFVPLLYGWLEAAGFRHEQAASLQVGDALPNLPGIAILTPEGQTLKPTPETPLRAESVGLYTLQTQPPQLLAVNLPPEESRITPLDPAKLRELGLPLTTAEDPASAPVKPEEKERLATQEEESRQRVWLWLLAAMLAILAAETWLANRSRTLQPTAT